MHGFRGFLVIHAEEELAVFLGLLDTGRCQLARGELGAVLAVIKARTNEADFSAVAEIGVPLQARRNCELLIDGLIELGVSNLDANQ